MTKRPNDQMPKCPNDTVAPMHLLVSVANAGEAAAALAGGADIIDAKDPAAGAMGAVPGHVFREIRGVVGIARPMPLDAPVTSATRPIRGSSIWLSGHLVI